ncbi:transposable element Tc1 transposase [Trichonephila clavipes]|nr:transposable element Tc1 transposase [Trichonephila clavipes]
MILLTQQHTSVQHDYSQTSDRAKCWNLADWGRIVFSEKFRFQLCSDNLRRHVRRRPGHRADPAVIIARHTGPQQGVIVWGAISFDSQTPLVVIRAHLQHSGDCIYQEMPMTCPDNRRKFGKKLRRRPSGCFITMPRRVTACIQARVGSTPY